MQFVVNSLYEQFANFFSGVKKPARGGLMGGAGVRSEAVTEDRDLRGVRGGIDQFRYAPVQGVGDG